MKLLPIPGLSGYRICVEELEAYKYKYGNLIKITPRTKYKIVSVQNDGATLMHNAIKVKVHQIHLKLLIKQGIV